MDARSCNSPKLPCPFIVGADPRRTPGNSIPCPMTKLIRVAANLPSGQSGFGCRVASRGPHRQNRWHWRNAGNNDGTAWQIWNNSAHWRVRWKVTSAHESRKFLYSALGSSSWACSSSQGMLPDCRFRYGCAESSTQVRTAGRAGPAAVSATFHRFARTHHHRSRRFRRGSKRKAAASLLAALKNCAPVH